MEFDDVARANRRLWEQLVDTDCGFTTPWLGLDRNLLYLLAEDRSAQLPEPLSQLYPSSVLEDMNGKDVLCLASGGGQQSAIFALLGATVTIVDIAAGQLENDRLAASYYGYEVTTIQADMRDLSMLNPDSFDLVFQAPSIAFVPDVRLVYAQVARVLRPNGLYRVEFSNPATEFVGLEDWDGSAYRITRPYTERLHRRSDGAIVFKHYLSDIFNGLLGADMVVHQVEEAVNHRDPSGADYLEPGSWYHWLTYISSFVVVARKLD